MAAAAPRADHFSQIRSIEPQSAAKVKQKLRIRAMRSNTDGAHRHSASLFVLANSLVLFQ